MPIPASPSTRTRQPAPSPAWSSAASSSASSESRPTRTGDVTLGLTRSVLTLAAAPARTFHRWRTRVRRVANTALGWRAAPPDTGGNRGCGDERRRERRDCDRRRAAGRQRAAAQRRRGVPGDGGRARRPARARSPTARPARGRTGSCGSTRCSAPAPSSRCARRAPTRTGRLPRLRVRDGESLDTLRFDDLGYAQAAMSSYRRVRPPQARRPDPGALPVPGVAAHAAGADRRLRRAPRTRARIEPLYEARMLHELATIFDAIPHDQLAIQWDTNFEFAMLDGVMPAWFDDPRSSIVERLVRLGRSIPADVQLGYHFCHGHERHHRERPYDAQPLVDIANALSLSLGRSLDWVHLPGRRAAASTSRFFETLAQLAAAARRRRLYLGLLHPADGLAGRQGADRRRPALRPRLRRGHRLRLGPPPAPGRRAADRAAPRRHRRRSSRADAPRDAVRVAGGLGARPRRRLDAPSRSTPSARPTTTSTTTAGTATSTRRSRSSPTCSTTATSSSTTRAAPASSLDRLKLRMFDTQAGAVIVDSSPKFLRVALEKFRDDPDGRPAAAALPARTRSGCSASTRCSAPQLLERGVDVDRVDQRRPPLPRPGRHRGVVAAGAAPGRARAHQLRQHPQPARPPQRVDPRRDGVGGRRPRRGAGAHRSRPTPPTAPTSTTPSGWRPTPPTATRCSSSPGRWTSTSRRFELAGPQGRVGARGQHRGPRRRLVRAARARTTTPCSAGSAAPRRSTGRRRRRQAVADRLALIRHAMDVLFHGRPTFQACWTYITCVNG